MIFVVIWFPGKESKSLWEIITLLLSKGTGFFFTGLPSVSSTDDHRCFQFGVPRRVRTSTLLIIISKCSTAPSHPARHTLCHSPLGPLFFTSSQTFSSMFLLLFSLEVAIIVLFWPHLWFHSFKPLRFDGICLIIIFYSCVHTLISYILYLHYFALRNPFGQLLAFARFSLSLLMSHTLDVICFVQ